MGKSIEKGKFIYIPIVQGQEDGANKKLEERAKEGKKNYTTKPSFNVKVVKRFENDLETESKSASPKFRCFISSEPPTLPTIDIIPEPKFDRRKFLAIGWSTKYNFNEGDLQIYADVLNNFP